MVAFVLHPGTLRTPVVLACALAWLVPAPVAGMMSVMEGNRPIDHFNDSAWPGLREVVNDESRVLFTTGPISQQTAYYQGDTTALNRVLRAFAATAVEARVVYLLPGRGEGLPWRDTPTPYDWRLDVNRYNGRVPEEVFEMLYGLYPTLTVFVDGTVDLERLSVPDAIQLVGIDVLRERYRRGLLSGDKHVRSVAVGQLSRLDPYGKESVAAVEKLIANLTNNNSVQRAIAEFDERAADPPEVRLKYEADERSIRDFILAQQYRALKVVLPIVLVTAATLLMVTVAVALAKRKRRQAGRTDTAT